MKLNLKALAGCLLLATLAISWLAAPTPTKAVQYNFSPGPVSVVAASANKAAASAVATLPAATSKMTYIEGFDIQSSGSTSAAVVNITVGGTTNTLNYAYSTVAGATTPNTGLSIRFPSPIPASAVNTAITVTVPSLGTGNTNATVTAYGFQQ